MEEISEKNFKQICSIFDILESEEDISDLFLDICTRKELDSIFQRLKIAQMLKDGLTFAQIEEITGISSTTITRVSKCLKNGKGYNKVFNKYNLKIDLEE
jgi:TrpR-related protein YerC/YecD